MNKSAGSRLRKAFRLVPSVEGFEAFVGARPAGHMHLRPSQAGNGLQEIAHAELAPEFRGMGLGRKLYGETMRRLPNGTLQSGVSVSPAAQGVWNKLQASPSYHVNMNPGAAVQTYNGRQEVGLTRDHHYQQHERRMDGLPRLPDNIYTGSITSKALKTAYETGARAALAQLKLAGPMGAEPGVQPKGPEQSHGTARIQYPPQQEGTSATRANMPDWLWDNFTTYDRMAPGRADGSYGQEVIG